MYQRSLLALSKKERKCLALPNGDSGSRTHDLLIANQLLYQLSYIPVVSVNID